jgi:hypothetical protein
MALPEGIRVIRARVTPGAAGRQREALLKGFGEHRRIMLPSSRLKSAIRSAEQSVHWPHNMVLGVQRAAKVHRLSINSTCVGRCAHKPRF